MDIIQAGKIALKTAFFASNLINIEYSGYLILWEHVVKVNRWAWEGGGGPALMSQLSREVPSPTKCPFLPWLYLWQSKEVSILSSISLLSESFHRCITLEVLIHLHHIIAALNCYPLNFRCRVQPQLGPLNLTSYCPTLYYSPNSIGSNTIQPARAVIGSPFWPSQSPCSW